MNLNRCLAALIGLVLLSLLGAAAWLEPNPEGLGTHQQLGLPPCSMILLLGIRCPSCGMTTSWAHFMNGAWWSSLQANLAGFLLAAVALACCGWSGWTAVTGRVPARRWQWRLCLALIAALVIAIAQWGFRLATDA